jgi:hypothetical protein
LLVFLSGCGYGKVSPKTKDIANALYTVCNIKQTAKLDVVDALIKTSLEGQEITTTEARYLTDIVSEARKGDWDLASQHSYSMVKEQASY